MEILYSDKILKDLKLAVLSDIHFGSKTSQKYLNEIINKVSNINPDFIIMPGDIIDNGYFDSSKKDQLLNFFKELKEISMVIMSLGNHDIKHHDKYEWLSKNNNELFNEISKINNIKVLNNDNYIDEKYNINFIGYTQPYETYKSLRDFGSFKEDINEVFENPFGSEYYNVLLAHNPMPFDELALEYVNILKSTDLIISGHMHGGLVHPLIRPLFKDGRGIISPDKKLFPKRTRGMNKLGEIDLFISDAYTKLPENAKIFRHLDKLYPKKIEEIKIKK